ncbi:MAG: hypothetical protein E7324_08200 [Clostridiales bacterium]|nr:hypothetical protein [Clostridiales bacterium]
MSKRKGILWLLALLMLLTGCSSGNEASLSTPTPLPEVLDAPEVEANGALADAARALLSPYEKQLALVAQQSRNNYSYTIPSEMISKMARDAQEMGAVPQNGFYQFTWRQSGNHTYTATGLEVHQSSDVIPTETPDVLDVEYDPMETQNMGDFSVSGGGQFDRSYQYTVADDLSFGRVEITNILNNEVTGHEVFSFSVRGKTLYFVYGALDLAASLDSLESTGMYLVSAGMLEENALEIVDYHVTGADALPQAESLDFQKLLSSITPLARISAKGSRVSVFP